MGIVAENPMNARRIAAAVSWHPCVISCARGHQAISAICPKCRSRKVVTRSDERLARLRSRLPAHGVVGYVGAKELIEEYDVNRTSWRSMRCARPSFPVAPINRLMWETSVLRSQADGEELRVIEDFGDGVLLYRRDSK